jgi:hypothetical protein
MSFFSVLCVGREWYPDFNMIHRTRYGAAYFVDEKFDGAQAHADQSLSLLAELGVSSSRSLVSTRGEELVVNDLLMDAMKRYRLDEKWESEWTSLAILLLSDSNLGNWTNKFGETVSREDVVSQLFERQLVARACFGCHVPSALCLARSRVNGLSRGTTDKIDMYLRSAIRAVSASQLSDGSISPAWRLSLCRDKDFRSLVQNANDGSRRSDNRNWSTEQKQVCTAHTLEWLISVSKELDVDEDLIRKAGVFLRG